MVADPHSTDAIAAWWALDARTTEWKAARRELCGAIPPEQEDRVISWCYDIALYTHLAETGGEHTPEYYADQIDGLLERIRAIKGREILRLTREAKAFGGFGYY